MKRPAAASLGCIAVLLLIAVAGVATIPTVPTGTWQPMGSMAVARSGAGAVLLQDHRVLITGGNNGTDAVSSAEVFNTDGSFANVSAMGTPRSGHVAVVLKDGRALVAGGATSGGGATNSAEIYDPTADLWTVIAGGMVEARSKASASLLPDGRVLIAGGQNGNAPSSTVEIFDPGTGQFSFAGSLSSPRMGLASASLGDGRVLITGGSNGSVPVATSDLFDPTTNTVSAGPAMTSPRVGHSATSLLDGRVLVAGGNNGSADLASAEVFDPATGVFAGAGAALTAPRTGFSAILLPNNNAVLIIGGRSAGNEVATAETFTPWTGAFAATGTPAVTRQQAALSALNQDGLLLMAGGSSAGTPVSSAELYGFATVKTDAADYAPGSIVTITGTGWRPGETVTLTLVESPLIDTHPALTAVADAQGHITNSDFVPDEHDLNIRFYLTAVGSQSGYQAQNTFTDAINLGKIQTVGSQTPSPVPSGNPATYAVTVSFTGNGATCNAVMSVTGLPLGTTFSFAPVPAGNPANTISSPSSGTTTSTTLTITTTAGTTPVGSSTFVISATGAGGASGCGGSASTNPTGTGGNAPNPTLAVSKADQTITFNALPDKTYGDADFNVSATASSGLTATFTASGNCTVTGTSVHITAAGSCTITAHQAGNSSFNAAPDVPQTFTIAAKTLTAAIVGDPTRPYNGNTSAALTSANFSLSGLVGSESITITKTSGSYNSKDVTTATTVTASLAAGDFTAGAGTTLSNYVLPTTASGPGHITALSLTAAVIGDPTKPYDGNTNATLTSANYSLSGLSTGDAITVTKTTGTYNSKDVPAANTVTVVLGGTDFTAGAGTTLTNYTLPTTANGAGQITAVTLTAAIINNPSRPYNGNTTAALTSANFSLSPLVGSENFTVTQTSGSYNSKDVVTANTVTASLSAGQFTPTGGAVAANYVLPTTASGPGHITAVTLTATIINNPSRPYNGNTNATLTSTNFSLSGLVSGESITVTQTSGSYNSKDVATANTVTASLSAGDFTAGAGTLLTNYVLPTTASGAGQITAVTLTAAIINNPTRPYNGNTNATLTSANFSLSGLVGSESITVTKTSGSYNSKDVATATTVTASLAAGDFTAGAGTLLTNYVLPTTASGAGQITAVTLTAAIINNPTRPYNGNTNATLTSTNFSLTGLVAGESITVTQTSGSYNSKDVATATTVTASLSAGDFTAGAGTLVGNYVLPTTASGAGQITAVTLTAAIINNPTRPYNGNTNATLMAGNFSLTGLVSGESITVTTTSGSYNSKDVATATTVTASLAAGDFTAGAGTLLTNYVLPTTTSGPGHITAVTLTAAIINNPTRPYNGNTNATLTSTNFSLTGLVAGESITVTQTSGSYNSKDVATANAITASLAAGDFTAGAGTTVSNYALPTTASGPGNITAVTLTAAIINNPTKPYDGNTTAVLTSANFSLSGLVGSENFTVTQTVGSYNSKDVGAANTVTASLTAGQFTPTGGALTGDYMLPSTASGPGQITAVTLTAAIIGDPTRPYNGNASATLTAANFSLGGLVGADSFTVNQMSGTYNDPNVALANTVSAVLTAANFAANGGTIATNYTLPTTASGPGHITQTTLTIHVSAANTIYTGLPYAGATTCSATGVNNESPAATLSYQDGSHGPLGGAPTNAGSYYAQCSAGGSGTNYIANSDTTGFNIAKATPTVMVSFSASPITFDGNPHPATATVTGVGGTDITTGHGTVTLTYTPGPGAPVNAGSYTASAHFASSDSNYTNADSGLAALTINKAATSTTVGSSPNPSGLGQSVTFTATVANISNTVPLPTPTGSVQFSIDGTPYGGAVPLVSGSASVSTSTLSVGSHSITAAYANADGNFVNSGSTTLSQQVSYGFLGFQAPYAMPPTTFNVKRTMPLKWQYTNASGAVVNSASANPVILIAGPYVCGGVDSAASIVVNDAGSSGYQYDPTTNTWQFNWQIKGNAPGCYNISVKSQQSGQTNGVFPISVVNQ